MLLRDVVETKSVSLPRDVTCRSGFLDRCLVEDDFLSSLRNHSHKHRGEQLDLLESHLQC